LREPGGRPGPGLVGLGARAGRTVRARRFGEAAADPGRCESAWRGGFLPGPAKVLGQRSGEAELGVRGDDEPGPAVGGLWGADLRCDPAQGLFE
jgi:hypothetical protein